MKFRFFFFLLFWLLAICGVQSSFIHHNQNTVSTGPLYFQIQHIKIHHRGSCLLGNIPQFPWKAKSNSISSRSSHASLSSICTLTAFCEPQYEPVHEQMRGQIQSVKKPQLSSTAIRPPSSTWPKSGCAALQLCYHGALTEAFVFGNKCVWVCWAVCMCV